MTQMYYRFIENNDHEGEIWNFFVPLTPTQVEQIRALVEVEGWEECYKLEERTYTEAEVQAFMTHESSTTYMAQYNRCGPLTVALPNDLAEDDVLYKGAAFEVVESCKS